DRKRASLTTLQAEATSLLFGLKYNLRQDTGRISFRKTPEKALNQMHSRALVDCTVRGR
ncbi:hypothetical protein SOVF_211730, partial [Spinacia oleracea]